MRAACSEGKIVGNEGASDATFGRGRTIQTRRSAKPAPLLAATPYLTSASPRHSPSGLAGRGGGVLAAAARLLAVEAGVRARGAPHGQTLRHLARGRRRREGDVGDAGRDIVADLRDEEEDRPQADLDDDALLAQSPERRHDDHRAHDTDIEHRQLRQVPRQLHRPRGPHAGLLPRPLPQLKERGGENQAHVDDRQQDGPTGIEEQRDRRVHIALRAPAREGHDALPNANLVLQELVHLHVFE
mmetsp:Transcript_64949/g.127723  ORF Transcript_64949/g.127723 Transcript_64949/m.127723 type:complete len:243 (-) Transcript_64949:159-887(-)